MSNSRDKNLLYFCDESSHLTDHHMAAGGLAINRQSVARIAQDIREINPGIKAEIKWSNANWNGGVVHRAFIDLLFSLIEQNLAHFHIRFAPFIEYDHRLSGPRKRYDTVSKMYYQLLLHRPLRFYGHEANIKIYPDNGDCTSHLPNMIDALHIEVRSKYGKARNGCIDCIEPRDSKSEPFLQLLDVTMGALASYRNNRHIDGNTGPIKRDLAEYAFQKTGWESIEGNNRNLSLSLWNVQPKWRPK